MGVSLAAAAANGRTTVHVAAVRFLLGCICVLLGVLVLVPGGVSLAYGEREVARGFALSSLLTVAAGGVLVASAPRALRSPEGRPLVFHREGMAVVGLGWIAASVVAAVPFLLCGASTSVPDALFEAVSGLTTTGSSVFSADRIDHLSRGVNFWRCFSQWIGGVGIVVVFIAVLPTGGRRLFRSEGVDRKAEEARVRDTALHLLVAYSLLTAVGIGILRAAGMDLFDSVAHSFSCISTGGFSVRGASIGHYDSPLVELACIGLMIAGGTNFALWTALVYWGPRRAWAWTRRSSELRLYLSLLLTSWAFITLVLWFWGGSNGRGGPLQDYSGFLRAARDSAFSLVSVHTTTGLATADFDGWPDVCRILLMLAAVVGACAGSTGGGIKVVRLIYAVRGSLASIRGYARPRAIETVRVDGEVVPDAAVSMVARFLVLYALSAVVGTLVLSMSGVAPTEALTGVIACLNTTGPGLGAVGPAGHFGDLPGVAKVVLSALMILGRLEFFALVALVLPDFWRR